MKASLLLRADASATIGIGHVMRGLALAQAWQDAGGQAIFASAEIPAALAERLDREQVSLRRLDVVVSSEADAAATVAAARECGASWLVVDGYRFTPTFLDHVRSSGLLVLSVDDMAHLAHYPVDLVLNQNLSARRDLYREKLARDTELLLGPRYSLLRREFRSAATTRPSLGDSARRVLVTFGGSDPENQTGKVLQRLIACPGALEVCVLAGAANAHVAALRECAARAPFPCEVRVDVANVAELMAWADVAITAGGSTVWELAAMRLPALIGAISEDQRAIGPALRRIGSFRAWTIEGLLEQELRVEIERLLAAPRDFGGLDAAGASRVVEQLVNHHTLSGAAL
jgi:UDP-2,4-diacetamido-2,4,6-trideoxy-beta-L-altropyranose hydrolase